MREHANIMKSWVLVAALTLALTPAPAYATTTDQILTYIWGELELMNDGQSSDSILYNVSNILTVDLQLFGQMASVATSLGENGNIDVTLDGIWEATTNTYYLVDTITDHVSNLDTNLYSIGQTIGNISTNLATSTNSLTTIKNNVSTISTNVSNISTKLTTSNTHLNSIKNSVSNYELGIDDISYYTYQTLTRLNEWKTSGYTVNTGLNLTPLLQELVNIETVINSLVNDSTKVFTVNTGLNFTPMLQELVNIESAISALDDNTYTVNTGLDLSPIVRELTNIETTLETDTIDVNTEWTAVDIAGMMLTQNSILSKLSDLYDYQRNYVNANLSSIFSELQLILGRWDAWKNAGYTVNTGLTIPSLSTIETRLQTVNTNLQTQITAWNAWKNSGYRVDTGLNLTPLLQELVNIESAINGLTFPTFNDTGIIQAINGLKGSVDAIHAWLLLGAVTDLVGDFDFDDLADKAGALLDNASEIAPFAGFALIASLLAIWSGSGALGEPSLQFDFEFFQPGDIVSVDLSWIGDALPLVHFLMISMLILCLVNSSMRIIELEATS